VNEAKAAAGNMTILGLSLIDSTVNINRKLLLRQCSKNFGGGLQGIPSAVSFFKQLRQSTQKKKKEGGGDRGGIRRDLSPGPMAVYWDQLSLLILWR